MTPDCKHKADCRQIDRRQPLAGLMGVRASLVALDSGETDEFLSSKAGDLAFSRRLRLCGQGEVAAVS
jgi:hypothetical protein